MTKQRKYIANTEAFSVILKAVWILFLVLAILFLVRSCAICTYQANIVDKTGYLPDNENWNNIPDVQPPYNDDDTLNLPEKVMLEHFFPPIGDQGEKGTCVVWATGYNLKTALNAKEKHWTAEMLKQAANQTSPKDLWLCIPQQQKGTGCSGTVFEAAFNALSNTGAASMEAVPYQDLRGCTGIGIGDTNNRIAKYYHVVNDGELPNTGQLKSYIADSIPLVIGARLGDRFMKWKNDNVISHDTYNYTGMHAYHAMVLVGYDNSRHAFRVRNSWGTEWGDEGSIWVDYSFFCNELCYVVFMAENAGSSNQNSNNNHNNQNNSQSN